jgi:hypothetical protein
VAVPNVDVVISAVSADGLGAQFEPETGSGQGRLPQPGTAVWWSVMGVSDDRLETMIVTRRITYQGGGPFVRALVEALEDQGVTVVVRRDGPYIGRHRESRDMGQDVHATMVATGRVEAINVGVGMFRRQFARYAEITIEGEGTPPPSRGRHRA